MSWIMVIVIQSLQCEPRCHIFWREHTSHVPSAYKNGDHAGVVLLGELILHELQQLTDRLSLLGSDKDEVLLLDPVILLLKHNTQSVLDMVRLNELMDVVMYEGSPALPCVLLTP